MPLTYTPLEPNAPALYSTFNAIFEELLNCVVDLTNAEAGFNEIAFGRNSGQQIVAGEFTLTRSFQAIDTEDEDPSDELIQLTRTSPVNLVFLQCVSAARPITVKHNVGNIYLTNGADITLDDQRKVLPLIYDGTKWCELGAGYWTSRLNLGLDSTLTIASDAITVSKARHTIDTQGGASTDNLSTINGGREGDVLFLNSASTARVITVKHAVGNIRTRNAKDIELDNPNRPLMLLYDGTDWLAQSEEVLVKEVGDSDYNVMRSIILPDNTLRSVTGTGAYRAALMPSPEFRNWMRIRAEDANDFISGDVEWDYLWDAAAKANAANGQFTQFDTTNVSGNAAYLKTLSIEVRTKWNPTFIATTKFDGSTSTRRVWIGLFDSVPGSVDSIGATVQGIGFRYSTNASDTNWKAVCSDGSAQTVVDTGVAVAGATKYTLKFRVDEVASIVYFSVNGSTEVSISTNLPANTTELGMVAKVQTLNASVKGLAIGQLYCEYD